MATKPFVVRWRDAVMDDPALSWRAKASAMPLVRHADVTTGRNCYPGAKRCAREMSVSVDTIERGWAELVAADWLAVRPLAQRYRKERGALKVMRFSARQPAGGGLSEPDDPLSAPLRPADSGATVPGNQKPSRTPRVSCVECGKRRVVNANLVCETCWPEDVGAWQPASLSHLAAVG
jgi:hypothetical protein